MIFNCSWQLGGKFWNHYQPLLKRPIRNIVIKFIIYVMTKLIFVSTTKLVFPLFFAAHFQELTCSVQLFSISWMNFGKHWGGRRQRYQILNLRDVTNSIARVIIPPGNFKSTLGLWLNQATSRRILFQSIL